MTMSDFNNNNGDNNSNKPQFGDTTLTKVFVGGLAWETPKQALYEHFEKFGEILEAVIISDKITGRSKGYGFVTFKEPEAAKKACEDATPIINSRRANCNLAALGARRPPRSSSTTPQPHQRPASNNGGGSGGGGNSALSPTSAAAPTAHVQWYYPAAVAGGRAGSPTPTTPYHPHQHHQPFPFYGYSPTYIAADVGYNHKLSYSGGAYINGGHYPQMYPGQAMMAGANTLMPIYPFYPYSNHHQQHHHQAAAMGLPAHIYQPTSSGPITAQPPIISKPTTPVCVTSPSVCLAVE
ncbi:probable RNA-binding protein ARP1 [Chenopodium quinoa]|uniref:probable RNA-binding protein ARP1 n=1 Tax=Chenopodium quinoa TaxID=63459 RepID=UPI000B77656D|nr:probable RNA-binding protein ARP1 [Chenopodium quinoa]